MNRQAWFPQTERLFILATLALTALALAYLPPIQVGALVVGGGGLLLLLRWPWLIWPLIGAALPFAAALDLSRLSLADVALVGAVGLWLADGTRRRSLRIVHTPLLFLTLLWLGAQSLALLGAVDLVEGGAEVVKWIEFAMILALAPAMLTPRQARWVVAALLLGGMAQATLGLYQFINRIGPDWFVILGRFMRASGSFGQPNPYAGYLGLCLPVAASLAIWACGQVGRSNRAAPAFGVDGKPSDRRWMRALIPAFLYSAAVLLLLAGILASWSRGAWLGAAAGLTVVVVLRSRMAALTSAIAALLLLTGMLLGSFQPEMVPAPLADRVADLPAYLGLTDVLSQPVTDENFAVVERVAHWVAALRMWEEAPWLGVGPGNYATIYPDVRLPRWEEALGHAHNIYLNVLAETGVIGLAAYLLLWAGAFVWVWRQFRHAPAYAYQGALAIGVLGVLTHLSVHNFFDNLYVQGIYLHLALLLAALIAAGQEYDQG